MVNFVRWRQLCQGAVAVALPWQQCVVQQSTFLCVDTLKVPKSQLLNRTPTFTLYQFLLAMYFLHITIVSANTSGSFAFRFSRNGFFPVQQFPLARRMCNPVYVSFFAFLGTAHHPRSSNKAFLPEIPAQLCKHGTLAFCQATGLRSSVHSAAEVTHATKCCTTQDTIESETRSFTKLVAPHYLPCQCLLRTL